MRKLTTEDFIKRAREKFNYDYSITVYKNKRTKIKFICPKHGIQEQLPENHIRYGCGLCGRENGFSSVRLTQDEIIKRFRKVHCDRYDYSLVDYKNIDTKVKIICKVHGVFEQSPYEHLKGGNCPYCYGLYKTTEQFIEEANKVHNNKYDYSLTEYKRAKIKVKIICPVHGIFEQIPNNHLAGQGCPECSLKTYKDEKAVEDYLIENNIEYKKQYKFDDCKNKYKLRFDFYLPLKNTAIEYDGKQHFEDVYFDGKESTLDYIKNNDKIKTEYCKNNNIKLIRIPYTELKNINTILEQEIN